jgi:hypothetical protein
MRYAAANLNPPWNPEDIMAGVRSRQDIPPQWAPTQVDLGCGNHGCVYETYDPSVVLKVTDDDTEAEVATQFGPDVISICVRYFLVLDSHVVVRGKPVILLWRERAFTVGGIMDAVELAGELLPPRPMGHASRSPPRDRAQTFLDLIFESGQQTFFLATQRHPLDEIRAAANDYADACHKMARQKTSPELAQLGSGMADVYVRNGLVFGDVHGGNLGLVHRTDGDRWVITDPGHVMVLAP